MPKVRSDAPASLTVKVVADTLSVNATELAPVNTSVSMLVTFLRLASLVTVEPATLRLSVPAPPSTVSADE